MSGERSPLLSSAQEERSYTDTAPARSTVEDVENAAPQEVKKPAMVTIVRAVALRSVRASDLYVYAQIVPLVLGIFLAALDTTIVVSCAAICPLHLPLHLHHLSSIHGHWERAQSTSEH